MTTKREKLSKASGIRILKAGKYGNTIYTKHAVKTMELPKVLPLIVCFDDTRIAGKVTNIEYCKGEVMGDFHYKSEYEGFFIAPGMLGNMIKGKRKNYLRKVELRSVSIVEIPYLNFPGGYLENNKAYNTRLKEEDKAKQKKKKVNKNGK